MKHGPCSHSLAAAFPFYVAFGNDLRIQAAGPALLRVAPDVSIGMELEAALTLRSPQGELSSEFLRAHPRALHLFTLNGSEVCLRGQVVYASEQECFIFAGMPWLKDVGDVGHGLSIGNFAAHDSNFEFLLSQADHAATTPDIQQVRAALQQSEAARERLVADQRALEVALNASADLRMRVRRDGEVLEMRVAPDSGAWSQRAESMIGQPVSTALPELLEALLPLKDQIATGGGTKAFELHGHGYVFESRALETASGDLVVVGRDVTDRRDLEVMLRHQALHDALTGLPNRVLLRERLDEAIRGLERRRTNRIVALLLVDLDDFKGVNDVLGHAVGDEVLVSVGRRIETSLRPTDCAARLGGDEFAVLLDDLGQPSQALEIAWRLRARIGEQLSVPGADIRPRASIGVAVTYGDCDSGTLTRQADLAMYRAKASVEGRPELFNETLQQQATERLELKQDLEVALERDEFVLFYQPVVELDTREITGVEALVRWRHPRHGLMGPHRFIEIAEESGAILRLGRRILEMACDQAAHWERLLPEAQAITLAVNLSANQLRHAGIKDDVIRCLARSAFPARRLTLEITESHVVSNVDETVEILSDLRTLGVRIAMDDFGTGYSALSYLERLPIDVLKIDKAFVDRLVGEDRSPLTEAVVGIGQSLGMQVVAEGIEHTEQAEALRELDCTLGQGYLYSPPVDAQTITDWLEAATPRRPRLEEKSTG